MNDMPGVGKVALASMIPILSSKGISVSNLPTALVSNTLDFGLFEILDTSDYMAKTIEVWKELNFKFDCIATGFMVNAKQVKIVEQLIQHQNNPNLLVVVDPIMGDNGHLYHGMTNENIEIMQELAHFATLLIPNYTEACLMTNTAYKESCTLQEAYDLIDRCCQLGSKSVVITSANVLGKDCVVGYDKKINDYFIIEYERIDVSFPGTGDIFSGVLISDLLNEHTLYDACAHAMNVVSDIIQQNKHKEEKFYGVDIERYISNNEN